MSKRSDGENKYYHQILRTLRSNRHTRSYTLRNAYNVDANHWKREQHQLHQRARNGPAYDYQILSAWGCAFTRVGGWKREGCWATARPAAPPPAPSRDSRKIQLSLSPSRAKPHPLVSSPSLLPPATHAHEALFAVSPRPYYRLTLLRSYSSSSQFFFRSFRRSSNSCSSSIALFYRILYFPCRPYVLRASSSFIAPSFASCRWPGITPVAIFAPGTVRLDIQADECTRAFATSNRLVMSLILRLPVSYLSQKKCSQKNGFSVENYCQMTIIDANLRRR